MLYDRLMTMASNLWWCWQPDVVSVFRDIDPQLWRAVNHNAVAFLKQLGPERLPERAADLAIESRLIYATHCQQEYLGSTESWGAVHGGPLRQRPVAYFTAEFGLHESLPLYSGGLGVLAGDHLKSASDLGLPVVGVGLFYDLGYFHQTFDPSGWQREGYGRADPEMLAVRPVHDAVGHPLIVEVATRTGVLSAQVLEVTVGRVRLLLLRPDTHDGEENHDKLSIQAARLYGGDQRVRIRQELLLGVGGYRALRAIGVEPGVLHLNEGHCAFAALEAIRHAMNEQGLSFWEAKSQVAAMTVFTSHTPVEAGHDRFPPDLVEEHLGLVRDGLGIGARELLGLGRVHPDNDGESFCMTVLALKTSQRANGVSSIHGQVTRRMWKELWPGRPEHEVPIGHITNGVHVASWQAPQMRRLFERYLGRRWMERICDAEAWRGIGAIDDGELWETHSLLKGHLVHFVRRRSLAEAQIRGEPLDEVRRSCERLSPDHLIIGFARRFALYKRAYLLLEDEAWLERFLCDPERPVQIIFAGKAHPLDEQGKHVIQRIFQLSRREPFRGHVFLLENYDINVGRHLVQGVDLWLNTPRRPLEACGTSGQKVVLNGGLNCSTLDGWWAEAFDGDNGFAIGSGKAHRRAEEQDRRDGEDLRRVLADEVVPLFYKRNRSGLPREWIARMKNALITLGWRYSAARMVMEYARLAYLPAAGATTAQLPLVTPAGRG